MCGDRQEDGRLCGFYTISSEWTHPALTPTPTSLSPADLLMLSTVAIIPATMRRFWVLLLWSALPNAVLFSGPEFCPINDSSGSQSMSPALESVRCHNDYESHVLCRWRKHKDTTLELWFQTEDGRALCEPDQAAGPAEGRTAHCRYDTRLFGISVSHTVFFLQNETLSDCSSVRHTTLDLFQRLRARPPANLSTHHERGGGRRILWSSPYPSSSSLNTNLTYQLSYRTHGQDGWTTRSVTTTTVKLERHLLLPGHRYEARARARAHVGQWSAWSPVVTWQTEHDLGQLPTLDCVLDGEREAECSWEVSRDLAHFITYQLACRRGHTAPPERCCKSPTVSPDHSGAVLTYSCSLAVAGTEHLLLDLQPTVNAKTFKAHQHIRPKPPQQPKVREKEGNWVVEWTKPSTALQLSYQVCYYRTQDQGSSVPLNISEGSTSVTILGTSLEPLQAYQVKVRSLLVPGDGSRYEGVPSEWTDPVDFTSNQATWSSATLIYVFISVLVAAGFLVLYCTVPACQRKVVLWVDSVPSPGKSKILSEMKSTTSGTLMQSEKTSICQVQHLDSVSTCSSDALLWPTKVNERQHLDQDESCWNCDALSCPAEKVQGSDTSSLSFSGPYIFCQSSEKMSKPVNAQSDEGDKETPSDVSASSSPVNFTVFGEGYVRLPRPNVSRSTQDLVSHSNANTSWHDGTEQDRHGPVSTPWQAEPDQQPGLQEPTGREQPPEYTSGAFSAWPQTAAVQASGYCHLPTACGTAAK
ncbi:cytokine receptor common subunit beta [Stegastes partitus]|uniref:Interleukin 4 receptor n=1 Tax=Stegastes partitus TaxID=144197 RepID=A0A3B5ALK1_9TELE|nr:PREDICTED: interleukin-4 receptor subunit alpha [Stegastes partitus]XP_008298715.1 PREDICTED: interleukin-4 receptor subunit alpha [Stegastes partitus]